MENQITKNTQATALPENCIMTLKDVVDTINNARGVKSKDKGFIQHGIAKKTIEEMSQTTNFGVVNLFLTTYIDKQGKNRELETLVLTKKQAIASGARLDNTMLMKVIDRVEELEEKGKKNLPQTFAEALRLAAKLEEEKQIALEEATTQRQIANKQTVLANTRGKVIKNVIHSHNTYTATQVAKDLTNGISAKLLNKMLINVKVIYRVGETYALYAKYQNHNMTSIKETKPDEFGNTYKSLRWTSLGKNLITKNLDKIVLKCDEDIQDEYYKAITKALPKI